MTKETRALKSELRDLRMSVVENIKENVEQYETSENLKIN